MTSLIDPVGDQQYLGDLFIETVNVYAKTTANVNGGAVATYAVSYANQPALVVRATDKMKLIYAQRNIELTHKILIQGVVNPDVGDVVRFVSGEIVREFFITAPRLVNQGNISALMVREVVGQRIIDESPN